MNGANDLSGIISRLTEDPEMMKGLMGLANNLKNSVSENKETDVQMAAEKQQCGDNVSEKSASGGIEHRKRGDDAENLIRLLVALKPYVGDSRCEKIDGIVKILKLIQLSEKTGLLKSLL